MKGGHDTDGFDVTGDGITIKNSWVHNQDDCLAINGATGAGVAFCKQYMHWRTWYQYLYQGNWDSEECSCEELLGEGLC
ncbi:hypothetical protein BC830DRAFT_1178952 [Chytriomyces sp. MP71]|nr:hypothetical protein BC830DRAFT_1178952 [Chytriomyces sp. MP71]